MNKTSKIRALCWLLLLFTSGAVLGSAFTPRRAASGDWWRRTGAASGTSPETSWVNYRLENISRRFDLTPDQQEALRTAFADAETSLCEVREHATRRTRRIISDNNHAIREVMTPEQVQAFDAWREDLRARRQAKSSNP